MGTTIEGVPTQVWYNGDPTQVCSQTLSVVGQWLQIQSSPDPSSVQIAIGVQRSWTGADSTSWEEQTTKSVNGGFKALGLTASAAVSGQTSKDISVEYSTEFQESTTVTKTFQFDAGVVWQWQFNVTDLCGSSLVLSDDFAVTPGVFQPPCCLPGFVVNISKYQNCTAASDGTTYNLCTSAAIGI